VTMLMLDGSCHGSEGRLIWVVFCFVVRDWDKLGAEDMIDLLGIRERVVRCDSAIGLRAMAVRSGAQD
jgi:hypothetical protein